MTLLTVTASASAAGLIAIMLARVTTVLAPDSITITPWQQLRDAAVLFAAFLTAALTGQSPTVTAAAIVALCAVATATKIDLAYRRIPNRLTASVAIIMATLTLVSVALGVREEHLMTAIVVGVAAPLLLFSLSAVYARYTGMAGFGMGDIKLVGPLTYAIALGGTSRVAVYAYTTFLAAAIVSGFLLLTGRAQRNTRVAFAPYFAVGTVVATVIWPHVG